MTFRCKYEYEFRFGADQHSWILVGRLGGLELRIRVDDKGSASGGLEIHYRSPPDYKKDDCPDHDECNVLKSPCWHDGTSLYVTEDSIPHWKCDKHNHRRMFKYLEHEYKERFKVDEVTP